MRDRNETIDRVSVDSAPLNGRLTRNIPVATSAIVLLLFGLLMASGPPVAQPPNDSPTIVLFVSSLSCSHCYEQIDLFSSEFTDTSIVVVSAQIDTEIQKRLNHDRVRFIHDPNNEWNDKLEMSSFERMHATAILDRNHRKVWEHIDVEPLIDVETVRRELQRLANRSRKF